MPEFYRAIIGVTSKLEAISIIELLLEKKLIAGGKYTKTDSIHHWQGKIDHEPYYNVLAYTINTKRDEIIKLVTNMHSDEVPAIYFDKIDYGNQPFLQWIVDNIE